MFPAIGVILGILLFVGWVLESTRPICDKMFEPDEFCPCPDCNRGKRP